MVKLFEEFNFTTDVERAEADLDGRKGAIDRFNALTPHYLMKMVRGAILATLVYVGAEIAAGVEVEKRDVIAAALLGAAADSAAFVIRRELHNNHHQR